MLIRPTARSAEVVDYSPFPKVAPPTPTTVLGTMAADTNPRPGAAPRGRLTRAEENEIDAILDAARGSSNLCSSYSDAERAEIGAVLAAAASLPDVDAQAEIDAILAVAGEDRQIGERSGLRD